MTEYVFRLSDETPKIEVDVKAAAIINGMGQDLYDRAKKELGYTGTFEQFLASFKGERGEKGDTGEQGPQGERGLDGASAYQLAGGYLKFDSVNEWLESLKGATGAKGDTGATGKSATVTIGTVTTGETASVTNTGTESAAVLNFVLPAGGQSNGLHTEIKTFPVTVNAQSIQTVEFEAKFAETPTLHGQPALMGAGENRFLYLLSVDKNGFTCRSNYFSAGVQTIHYAVTGKLA